jgi:DNA-binding Lrp family transcriptional regulator
MNKTLDSLDRKIINLLGKDGRMTVPKIFETLEITNPTARSRIKNLIQQEVLRIVGLIDSSKVRDFSIIIVGISLTRHNELDKKLDQISKLDNVHWAIAVS